ncbi:MAG: creatininase family protein [Gemmatimonadales bacterium]|jgi:creatinine amidohydrolase|nr:MAG: creatininase family protein [Gemmatimonadales bacterium]
MNSNVPALENMPWTRVQRILARDPRLLLAVGALEQAGPHLPLGTNFHIAQAVVDEVAGSSGILRAPGFCYGVRMKGSRGFAGTAGLSRKSLHRTVNELLAAWEDHGVQEFILVTGHRSEAHLEALLMALTSEAQTTVFDLSAIEVGDLLEGEPGLEHGGERETSLVLHLMPETVSTPDLVDVEPTDAVRARYRRGHPPTPPPGTRGVYGYPSRASAEKGRRLFHRYVTALESLLSGALGPEDPA